MTVEQLIKKLKYSVKKVYFYTKDGEELDSYDGTILNSALWDYGQEEVHSFFFGENELGIEIE